MRTRTRACSSRHRSNDDLDAEYTYAMICYLKLKALANTGESIYGILPECVSSFVPIGPIPGLHPLGNGQRCRFCFHPSQRRGAGLANADFVGGVDQISDLGGAIVRRDPICGNSLILGAAASQVRLDSCPHSWQASFRIRRVTCKA